MSKRGVLYCVIVFYSILIGGCRGMDSATCDDCTLCKVSNLQVQKICIPDGVSLSNAIDIAFNAAKEGMAERVAVIMRLPEDGEEPKVEGFSAAGMALRDVLKLICESCNYCYVIDSEGVVCLFPRFTECIFPFTCDGLDSK